MRRVFYRTGIIFFTAAAALVLLAASGVLAAAILLDGEAAGGAAILLDGEPASGYAVISAGGHSVTARAEGDVVWIAVYENGQFKAISCDSTLEYDFPESGAEIALFRMESGFRPLGEAARVRQITAEQKLVYSGQAYCYPDDDEDFSDYIVRLRVVTQNGKITEIKEIAGYNLLGSPTSAANTLFLNTAAAGISESIIQRQSTENIDAVTGATCASEAILRAVKAALSTTPELETDPGEEPPALMDGTYAGSAQCLTGYINYMVDVDVTVKDGLLTEIKDRTLKTPMSSNDKVLYSAAWRTVSRQIAKAEISADGFSSVDAVSGATVSTAGISAAIRNALETRSAAQEEAGDVYAPEGISLYARAYPIATVRDGKLDHIRIVPAGNTDTERLEQFAAEIVRTQSVSGLVWPDGIQDDAFSIANLTDQILYETGILQ